jgi:dihydroxyacid dehydratase/phosphogluconate dehydratase
MKMHSSKFRDPLITRPQPVTVLVPVIEEALRLASVQPHRDLIIDRFMNGAPRVAVVHGSEDHPPAVGSKEMSRRLVRFIWASGGLPFEVAQSFPCEELSHATDGAHYALLSRNFCSANMASHMEEHSYDGAIVIGVCDKMMVGNLRALIETDLARQRRRARPIFAMVIPPAIGREVFVNEEDRRRFEPLKARLPEGEQAQLDELLHRPMKPNVYAQIKTLLDRYFNRRIIQEAEKDELEHCLVRCTSVIGSNCAASEASMIHRMMLASFGLVPRHLDVLVKPPTDDQLSDMVKRLFTAILKRERRMSVASLVRSNLINASAVWSATGGHPGWLLHLSYLANATGKKLEMEDIIKKVKTVPQVLAINEPSGNSAYLMGVETENGGNSGIDTIMRTLSEKRLIEDRAGTFDGSWMQRIVDARSANGNFLFSTMTPYAPSCGMMSVHGNLCAAGVARLSANKGDFSRFDQKIYLAICYLGIKELLLDLESSEGVFERLKRRVDRDDLYYTWLFNRAGSIPSSNGTQESWNKNRLWEYLIGEGLLRAMVVVAGVGPRAAGMPEVRLSSAAQPNMAAMTVLVTDGRVSFQNAGVSISHLVPEAMDGGALGAVRTGDWIYMDVGRGELQLVSANRTHDGYKVMPVKDLLNRPDLKKRVHELERRRLDLLPSFRVLLDQISSAESGVSPTSK